MNKKYLIIQTAALGFDLLKEQNCTTIHGLSFNPITPVFPALTCPFQASLRTAARPAQHGMIANGLYHRALQKPLFWEQSAQQIEGKRIWDTLRNNGRTVGLLFWQQSLGEKADLILSPAPIHKHHGGMILDCYSKPTGLYQELCSRLKRPFALKNYWGPLASAKAGQWIAEATAEIMQMTDIAPDLLLTYLPTLDYDLQRFGPHSPQATKAIIDTLAQLDLIMCTAEKTGYEILIIGDYAIGETAQAIYPNRILLDAGLFSTRRVKDMLYPDIYSSHGFAMVDHEVTHLFIQNADDIQRVTNAFASVTGIEVIQPRKISINHPNAGELILLAKAGYWFAYPWWNQKSEAPDYATHIDIHNKPGYDPCELFWGFPALSVSTDTTRIKGSHGRIDRPAAFASSFINECPGTLLELTDLLEEHLR